MKKPYQWIFILITSLANAAWAGELATAAVTQSSNQGAYTAEGVVEAVRNSVISPQVSGSVIAMTVKAGDRVKVGQSLLRIDTRLAVQQTMTNQAQVIAAQAQLDAARKEYERKRRLYEKQYLSQAALERAESDFKTAEAQTKAQLAQTGMANVQAGLHTINAPYTGVVAEVLTELGDMAMPGKPLLSVYDPSEMRVVVNVPQSQLGKLKQGAIIQLQIPGASVAETSIESTRMTILPTADPVSNMVKVRLALPSNLASISPGMFARAVLPVMGAETKSQIFVPAQSIIRRSELTAVYVVDSQGQPRLRQVRLGRQQGELIEVFAGLQAGEKVALDPVAASRQK